LANCVWDITRVWGNVRWIIGTRAFAPPPVSSTAKAMAATVPWFYALSMHRLAATRQQLRKLRRPVGHLQDYR